MINNLKNIYPFVIFVGIVLIVLSLILFFGTIKYKKRKLKTLAIFASLSKRNIVLISTIVLNFLIVIYFLFQIKNYSDVVTYLIIVNGVISIITSLNIHMLLSTILYSAISILSLKIVSLTYNYLANIYYDRMTFILACIFILLLVVYEIYVTFRQVEIVMKKSKGGIKDGAKQ